MAKKRMANKKGELKEGSREGKGEIGPSHGWPTCRRGTTTRQRNVWMPSSTHPHPSNVRCPLGKCQITLRANWQPHKALTRVAPPPPPYQLWTHTTPQDVMDPTITKEEVKRTFQNMDMSSAPGSDCIQFGTWKHLDPQQEIVTAILNTCRANGKIPPPPRA